MVAGLPGSVGQVVFFDDFADGLGGLASAFAAGLEFEGFG
jgi:hypothetical protein